MVYLLIPSYPLISIINRSCASGAACRATLVKSSQAAKEAARQAVEQALAEPLDVCRAFFLDGQDFIGGTSPSIAGLRLCCTLEFLAAIDYALPDWARDYVSATQTEMGDAYAQPAADVRGRIEYVKSQGG